MLELLVAMVVTTLVMAGVFSAMTDAMRSFEAAKLMTGMNSDLRIAMDMIVRDLLQTGQGLPIGRQVGVANGEGATPILRPGPPANNDVEPGYPGIGTFPVGSTLLAVTVGPDLGPQVSGQPTDVITILMVDGAFDQVPLRAVTADGSEATMVVALPADNPAGKDIADEETPVDNIRVGDLIMLRKGSTSILLQATQVSGQTVTFGAGTGNDLNLNQFDVLDDDEDTVEMAGTANKLVAQAPVDEAAPTDDEDGPVITGTNATRVRMITYYVDPFTDPTSPRLMRIIDSRPPTTVSFGTENLRFTYDIVDGLDNPASLRMLDSDITPSAASPCDSDDDEVITGCSPSQIRKVNVVLAGRSRGESRQTREPFRNAVYTQVSLRSLAFVDRYQ